MTIEEIEQIAKKYLKENNISFEAKNENEQYGLIVKKWNNLFYIEVHNNILTLGEEQSVYLKPCDFPSYRFVLDENGNIVIPLAEIERNPNVSKDYCISLDEENVIVPVKSKTTSHNNSQHFKIKNGKGILINTFEGKVSLFKNFVRSRLLLTSNMLLSTAIGLYDFGKGIILKEEFERIITSEKEVQYLAKVWEIPDENRQEFINTIMKKMEKEHLIGGYKKISVQKEGYERSYYSFIFMDKIGNFVSNLYYVDDYVLASIDNISPENIKEVFQQLEQSLVTKIDALIAVAKEEEKKKRNLLQQLKMELIFNNINN